MAIQKFDADFKPVMKDGRQDVAVFNPEWVKTGLTVEAVQFAEYFGRFLVGPKMVEDKKNPGKQMVVFVGGMSTSQIRNFFGEVRKLQMKGFADNPGDFAMLRPRLAFAKVRSKENVHADTRIKDFEQVMLALMDEVEKSIKERKAAESDQGISPEDRLKIQLANDQHCQNFVDFLEATVAYHKANGGKN